MASAIINYEQLWKLLHDFDSVTGIRITYFLPNGEKYISSNKIETDSSLCKAIKSNTSLCEKCGKCDQEAIEKARRSRKMMMYQCHAGVNECVYPVIWQERILGFLMIGQVRYPQDNPETIIDKLHQNTQEEIDDEQMKTLFYQLPIVDPEKMEAVARMMQAVACYTYLNGYIRYVVPKMIAQIEEYIEMHLDESISLDDISGTLFISKSKLCHIVREEMNMSVVQMIQTKRINRIKELLSDGKTLVAASQACGYNDPSYCSRVFKKITGISPREYVQKSHSDH